MCSVILFFFGFSKFLIPLSRENRVICMARDGCTSDTGMYSSADGCIYGLCWPENSEKSALPQCPVLILKYSTVFELGSQSIFSNVFTLLSGSKFTARQEKHIKDLCRKRQVTCAECNECYAADMKAEHEEKCEARLINCRLCDEEVSVRDMKDHLSESRGCRVASAQLIIELLDKVASLEAEVKKLKARE